MHVAIHQMHPIRPFHLSPVVPQQSSLSYCVFPITITFYPPPASRGLCFSRFFWTRNVHLASQWQGNACNLIYLQQTTILANDNNNKISNGWQSTREKCLMDLYVSTIFFGHICGRISYFAYIHGLYVVDSVKIMHFRCIRQSSGHLTAVIFQYLRMVFFLSVCVCAAFSPFSSMCMQHIEMTNET